MLKRFSKIGTLILALVAGLAACDGDDPVRPADLAAPAALTVAASSSAVQLTWTAVPGATGYNVQRMEVGATGGFADVATELGGTSFTDTGVSERRTYLYRVVARSGSLVSEPSGAEVARTCANRVLCGTIVTGDTLKLSAGTYHLQGVLAVDSGAVLDIPAGTTVLGDVDVKPTAVLVRRGGKIFSRGTPQSPVVFTSSRAPGSRNRGDWGGILIAGYSTCNFAAPCEAEGIPTTYGGSNPQDSSGEISYTRIEFAGFEVAPGNELNGLTLLGVGSGTSIHHVQVHHGADDGIEFFGGTVDVKYALVTGADDDSFDYSTGWSGRGQFWIAQQTATNGDKAFEVDGNEKSYTATPLTDPQIYNVTLIGRGGASSGNDAIQLRRGVRGNIRNAIVTSFGGSALDVDDPETAAHCSGATRIIGDVISFGNGGPVFDSDSDTLEAACAGHFREVDPMLAAASNRSAPDFRPAAGSPALSGAAAVPAGDFFEAAPYLGAVAPAGAPWYQGWTTFAAN